VGERAPKVLYRKSPTDDERFKREVAICERRSDLAILPVLDSHLPGSPTSEDRPWFVMPLARSIVDARTGASLPDRVAAIRDVGARLAQLLVEEGINHRELLAPKRHFRVGARLLRPDADVDRVG
jgi:hypothetical protein